MIAIFIGSTFTIFSPHSKPKNPFAVVGQPRTEMVKFRCSKDFKALLLEMAKIKDCSIADLLHKSIQVMPKFDYKFLSIHQDRLNEII